MPSFNTLKYKKNTNAPGSKETTSPDPEGEAGSSVGGKKRTWSQDMRSISKKSRANARAARAAQKKASVEQKKPSSKVGTRGNVPSFMRPTANSALRQRSHKERTQFSKNSGLARGGRKVRPFKVLRMSQTFKPMRKGGKSAKSANRMKSIRQLKKALSRHPRNQGPSALGSIEEGTEADSHVPDRVVRFAPDPSKDESTPTHHEEEEISSDEEAPNVSAPPENTGTGFRRSGLVRERSTDPVKDSSLEGQEKKPLSASDEVQKPGSAQRDTDPQVESGMKGKGDTSDTGRQFLSNKSSVRSEEELAPVPVRGKSDAVMHMRVASELHDSVVERARHDVDTSPPDAMGMHPVQASAQKDKEQEKQLQGSSLNSGLGSGSMHHRVNAARSHEVNPGDSSRTVNVSSQSDPSERITVVGSQRTREVSLPLAHLDRSSSAASGKKQGVWWELGAGFFAGVLTAVWLALARGCEDCVDAPEDSIEMEPLIDPPVVRQTAPPRDLQEEWLWHNA